MNAPDLTGWASIGRNVRSVPMSDESWRLFRRDLTRTVGEHHVPGTDIVHVAGSSTWEGDDEETHLILVTIPVANEASLLSDLSDLANLYEQYDIGWVATGGPTTVNARRRP